MIPFMTPITILITAMILDSLMGEPKPLWQRLPHPVVLMGRLIALFNKLFNRGRARRAKGIVVIITLATGSFALGAGIERISPYGILDVVVVAVLLGYRSLITHVVAVADSLKASTENGRAAVAHIVGRETKDLDKNGVACAAIESCSENFSDGVLAPILWYCVGGLGGLICYKMVNTADSMIGYKTDDYRDFGMGAARLDDIMNWIPARVCAVAICLTHWSAVAWRVVWADARHHASPNAGWPESAMAGVLDVRLAGPRVYKGAIFTAPYINEYGHSDLGPSDIIDATRVVGRVWQVILGGLIVWFSWFWVF